MFYHVSKPAAGGGLLPLVDVVFLLLIFFMLTFSLSRERAITVNMPKQADRAAVGNVLLVKSDGSVALNGEPLAIAAIGERLGGEPAHIRAEEAAELQKLVTAMEAVALAGSEVTAISVEQ